VNRAALARGDWGTDKRVALFLLGAASSGPQAGQRSTRSVPSNLNSIPRFRLRASNRGVAESQRPLIHSAPAAIMWALSPLLSPGCRGNTTRPLTATCPVMCKFAMSRLGRIAASPPPPPYQSRPSRCSHKGQRKEGCGLAKIIGTIWPILCRFRVQRLGGRRASREGPYELVGVLTV
jgi:hypothetical protein